MGLPSVKTSTVRVGIRAPYFESKYDLLNCYDSLGWILARRDLVGWTYSCDVEYLRHFKKLIVGIAIPHPKVKHAGNCHQKVYIDKKEMLISTMNLVAPTIQNVSFIIRDPIYLNYMKILFNKQWKVL